jgi:hypothetical protein
MEGREWSKGKLRGFMIMCDVEIACFLGCTAERASRIFLICIRTHGIIFRVAYSKRLYRWGFSCYVYYYHNSILSGARDVPSTVFIPPFYNSCFSLSMLL